MGTLPFAGSLYVPATAAIKSLLSYIHPLIKEYEIQESLLFSIYILHHSVADWPAPR